MGDYWGDGFGLFGCGKALIPIPPPPQPPLYAKHMPLIYSGYIIINDVWMDVSGERGREHNRDIKYVSLWEKMGAGGWGNGWEMGNMAESEMGKRGVRFLYSKFSTMWMMVFWAE